MVPAATKAGGMCLGVPDVCLTPAPPAPPVPVPYPNMAQWPAALNAVLTVLVENKETVTEGTKIPNSSGDEAGVSGGVTSGTFMGPVEAKTFSSKVFFAGRKAVMLTAMTGHNGSNANMPAGVHMVPSQATVFVAF
ncbi:PAAR-like domain-containing protein [Chondromyces crocatus]|uniref:Type VI secretion protein n=1 Tax=Chondromyces crocatus TaxID=52 RepID=A0A0K1ESD9_CHOCO|nr:PAAR-like domain-containing protein [Chondromyces crocatus]AKT43709.1 type VI secretion protein [Chondromyces crocatus]